MKSLLFRTMPQPYLLLAETAWQTYQAELATIALGDLEPRVARLLLMLLLARIDEAVTRVLIESEDEAGERWTTVGVSPNIIDASFQALMDSVIYKLVKSGAPA